MFKLLGDTFEDDGRPAGDDDDDDIDVDVDDDDDDDDDMGVGRAAGAGRTNTDVDRIYENTIIALGERLGDGL